MKFALYTNSLSAHQLPLAREIVKRIGAENFRYIYTGTALQGGAQEVSVNEPWIVRQSEKVERVEKFERFEKFEKFERVDGVERVEKVERGEGRTEDEGQRTETVGQETSDKRQDWLEDCDVLLVGGLRPIELLERRSAKGLRTFYQSERWFKPIPLTIGQKTKDKGQTSWWQRLCSTFNLQPSATLLLPGWLRMLVPGYRRMAKRFVKLMREDPKFTTLPIGPWAKKDFLRLGVPAEKMMDWGYFVAPAEKEVERVERVEKVERGERGERVERVERVERGERGERGEGRTEDNGQRTEEAGQETSDKRRDALKLLWVGRMMWLKRIDTLVEAVKRLVGEGLPVTLTLVGDGEARASLEASARGLPIVFRPAVPLEEVRALMRSHDVYVFTSNGMDGWGAVVSEAAEEGMLVLGTRDTGASAAMLPPENQFACGDAKHLAELIRRVWRGDANAPRRIDMAPWRPTAAAEKIVELEADRT